jgi:hypothetical protein
VLGHPVSPALPVPPAMFIAPFWIGLPLTCHGFLPRILARVRHVGAFTLKRDCPAARPAARKLFPATRCARRENFALGALRSRRHTQCGVAPIPASSGKTNRHRLHRGGDRAGNSALHIAAVLRLRYSVPCRCTDSCNCQPGRLRPSAVRAPSNALARPVARPPGRATDDYSGAVAVEELRRTGRGWVETAPTVCANGDPHLPGQTLVGYQPCSCLGGHRVWRCGVCGAVTTGPRAPK